VLLAGLSLLAPTGLLVCLVALLPPVALVLVARRQISVAASIGLRPAPLRAVVPTAVASATACLALGLAAAQPVLTTTDSRVVRTRSEIVFLVDVSRSMLASASPDAPNRLTRARSVVERLRLAAPDVPAGISGLTDRALPYVFPTLDAEAFSATLAQSVQVDAPPPLWSVIVSVATSFAPLQTFARDGFFGNRATYRTCVLVTDGEARSTLGEPRSAGSRRCRLVVVRVGDGGDRIFGADGRPVASYRPEASAPETVARVVQTMGGVAFREGDLGSAAAAVRAAAEQGPRATVGVKKTVRPLAPAFAGLALLLVVGIVALRSRRTAARRLQPTGARHYHFRPDARARRAG
jgi:hypothetical protein